MSLPTPSQPIVNAGLSYINGLNLAYATTTTLTISPGSCRDSTNTNDIQYIGQLNQYNQDGMVQTSSLGVVSFANPVVANLPANITISPKLVSGAGAVGLNGIDTGTLAAASYYAVFVIADSYCNNVTGGLISLSATSPNLPEGYNMVRRLGFIQTASGTATILPFWQDGGVNGTNRKMWYDTLINITTTAEAAFTTQSLAAAVPDAVGQTEVLLQLSITPATAGNTLAFRPTGSASTAGNAIMSADVTGVIHQDQIEVLAAVYATSGHVSIDYKDTSASDVISINVAAYVDNL